MKYQLSFGRLPKAEATRSEHDRFRLAVLADLSGRASRGQLRVGKALAKQSARKVDVDNFEQLLAQAKLCLNLDFGSETEHTGVEIPIQSLDDFHPDELYHKLDFFRNLADLRQRLGHPDSFEKAAREVQSWSPVSTTRQPPTRSASVSVPRGKFSDFAQLVGRATAADRKTAPADALIRQIVGPHIVATADPRQEALVSAVDEALADSMRHVLHHPDFQSAESTWRSIDLLTRRLETGPTLDIVLYDISAEEIAADLSSTSDLTQTGLYQLLVEQPALDANQGPLSAVVANYLFEPTPPHADLLARLVQIAAAARFPFLAGLSSRGVEHYIEHEHDLCQQAWRALQALPQSVYLGLISPRFMLRWPYGTKTEPIESFPFEEFTTRSGLKGMLWGNGAILAGLVIGQTFLRDEIMADLRLGAVLNIDDLPLHTYTDQHGDVVALPCGERLLTESTAARLTSLGCIPLLSMKGRPEVRLGGLHSVHGAMLAGPWAPVEVDSQAPNFPLAADVAARSDTRAELTTEEDTASAGDSDFDVDTQLDAILNSLDDEDEVDNDDNMDPELARLLEGL